ncbi:MAG: HDOD domain-containing protein [Solirubrobacterales bacterium]
MSDTATIPDPAAVKVAAARPMGAGGRRLAASFDAISSLPALLEARERLVSLAEAPSTSSGQIADVIESDAALAIAIMQAANNGNGPRGRTGGVPAAIDSLSATRVVAIAGRMDTYDLLGPAGSGSERFERFRRHAASTRCAADRVAGVARIEERDELAVAALMHDVGRLVLGDLYGPQFGMGTEHEDGPEERLRRERRELGVDHALVGAVLVRRWGLPASIASAVERHHSPDADGIAAAVQLADLIVHHAAGDRVAPGSLRRAAERVGLDEDGLRGLLFEFPHSGETPRRASEPCPLSNRERDALRGLAEGKVYKQIAQELTLSVSTVRTHLHNVYKKIGAVDRAQAVLIARERGWI